MVFDGSAACSVPMIRRVGVTVLELDLRRFTHLADADGEVQRLVDEVQAYYVTIYGGPDDSPFDAAEFAPPAGQFVLGTLDDEPVAMGGWRHRPDLSPAFGAPVAEIKRMFVSPRARRRGFANTVLAELERTATAAGNAFVVLETGTIQADAIALYERAGYRPTLRFGHYAWSPTARYFARPMTSLPLPVAPAEPDAADLGRQDP